MLSEEEERLLGMMVLHPGWQALRKLATEEILKREKQVMRQVLSREPADQRAIDFVRGYRAGCAFLADIREPKGA